MGSLTDRAARSGRVGTLSGKFPLVGAAPPVDKSRREGAAPARVCALAASTGGPPAIHQILAQLDPGLPLGVIVTQHMPAKFTRAFAERLDRTTRWKVREAEPGDALTVGVVLVAPGSGSLVMRKDGVQLKAEVAPPASGDRFVPSVDRMFEAAAQAMGPQVLGVVLTGMGGDGGRGVRALKGAGGRVIAEAPETAIIFGMPEEAIATGLVDEIVPLPSMVEAITRFCR
jgi:two-component system chemotaxis response regulator CheB